MVPPLPWLLAKSRLRVLLLATIIIIITPTWVGRSSKTIQLPQIVVHLQLKISNQPHQLLMLLNNGLQLERRRVSDWNKKRNGKERKAKGRKNSLLECWKGKDSP